MEQTFYFNAEMTRTFLRYAEATQISNQKVLLLIDDLRKGLSVEEMLEKQGSMKQLHASISQNVRTCYRIMFHVLFLADLADDRSPYDRFMNGWNTISAS